LVRASLGEAVKSNAVAGFRNSFDATKGTAII